MLRHFKKKAPWLIGTPAPESGREDLNLRPLDPQSSALTRLRYAPTIGLIQQLEENIHLVLNTTGYLF